MTSREKIKVEITNSVENRGRDCFVSDTNVAEKKTCEGIPKSSKCAMCRLKKNQAGIPAY